MNKNTVDLARLESRLRETEDGLDMMKTQINNGGASVSGSEMSFRSGLSQPQMDRYWKCRRSLRLWPVRGPDFLAASLAFMLEKLGADVGLFELKAGDVRRIIEPKSKIPDEVVVEFPIAAIRDSIKSLGFKLEGQRAGIRMEIPNFLKSDFYVLQNLSYKLKQSNKSMKRGIKFDEENFGVMLDIQLPGQDWSRIRPDQAREAGRSDPSLRSGPLVMSGDMIASAIRGGQDQESSGSSSIQSLSGSNAEPLGRRPT